MLNRSIIVAAHSNARRSTMAGILAIAFAFGCAKEEAPAPVVASTPETAASTTTAPPKTHADEIHEWRETRLENLTKEDGWLTLVGLAWLRDGDNSVGSDPKSVVALPAGKAEGKAGTIKLAKGKATFFPESGGKIELDGKPVIAPVELKPDTSGEPTMLRSGPVRFYLIERGGKLGVRIKDGESEARKSFTGIETYPIDAKWRVEARLEKHDPPKRIPITNVLGQTEPQPSPGTLVFEIDGKSYSLDPILEGDDPDYFIIFGDTTNRTTTYGAGRFLYAAPAGPDGKVIIDFNKAYNPPCVFSPYATCPLPPKQNKLPIAIEAGEKRWGEH